MIVNSLNFNHYRIFIIFFFSFQAAQTLALSNERVATTIIASKTSMSNLHQGAHLIFNVIAFYLPINNNRICNCSFNQNLVESSTIFEMQFLTLKISLKISKSRWKIKNFSKNLHIFLKISKPLWKLKNFSKFFWKCKNFCKFFWKSPNLSKNVKISLKNFFKDPNF